MYKGVLFPFGDEAGRCILEWLMCPAVSLCCPVLLDNNLDNKLEYSKNNVLKVVKLMVLKVNLSFAEWQTCRGANGIREVNGMIPLISTKSSRK